MTRLHQFPQYFLRILLIAASCIAFGGYDTLADPKTRSEAPRLGAATERAFAPIDLRGYGRVEGTSRQFPGASVLRIRCEDESKAELVQAKYLSDLGLLPGTRAIVVRADQIEIPAVAVGQHGVVAAGRDGKDVFIFAANSQESLHTLVVEGSVRLSSDLSFRTEVKVPVYLDGWDRYGFRFYYRPWETPPGSQWKDYDVLEEFDFANRLGGLSFVFWAKPDDNDTGPGLTNRHWWDWAARAARRRDLPMVVNTVRTAPTWLLNTYRNQVMAKMPQYCGSFHSIAEPHHDGLRKISWCATEARDAEYAILQQHVKEMSQWPHTIDYMEPNCELKHGAYDVLLEYGPVADSSYREFLRDRYVSLRRLGERWHGDEEAFRSWEDITVPELASFLGWGPDAIDLTGPWRIAYERFAEGSSLEPSQLKMMQHDDIPTVPAPDTWYSSDFDDGKWPTIQAPGNDLMMFLPKRPAVFRRSFHLPTKWLRDGERAWLYLWDLNYGKHNESWVRVAVNGQEVGRDTLEHAKPHWSAFEVTGALATGENVVAARVPKGVLAYRVYLSKQAPRQYPELGEHGNAQWVDFSDWRRQTRLDTCRRGIEMIRQIDPNRSIILAAPDGYITGIKQLCEEYGGRFHNTGHMGAFWNDFLPALMRGSDLPFSLEPGGPAHSLDEFKKQMGLYFTEGIQAIHYFIHVGNIMWPRDIRTHFERIQPLVKTIGKVHPPKGQVAMLLSNRAANLSGYPWGKDYNVDLPTGYWGWRISDALTGTYHVDAITDVDFGTDTAEAYPVVLDTNTSVMDEDTVDRIEQWVRNGGIFVTFIQTGRHTPEHLDRWPISRLTGYRVTHIDPHKPSGSEGATRFFTLAEDQTVFKADDWPGDKHHNANGLSLEKEATECQNLILWKDGSVAAGLRPLGKGYVVHLGIKFGSARGGVSGNNRLLLQRVLKWSKVPRLCAQADRVTFRHYVSNNGLYDVWTLWNRDRNENVDTRIVFRDGLAPASCFDILDSRSIRLADEASADRAVATDTIRLEPLETRIYLTPRDRIASAPLDWFELQRHWWRGTRRPAQTKLHVPERPNVLDLTDGWAYRVLEESSDADGSQLADPGMDDSDWPRRPLNCWAVGEELSSRHVFFRRTFTVPEPWRDGELTLWLRSYFSSTVIGQAQYWLDGNPIPAGDGRNGLIHQVDLKPGSTHCLAVEICGKGAVCGVRGNTWLDFIPTPKQRLNLAGEWIPSPDLLHWKTPIELPGRVDPYQVVRREFVLPEDWTGDQVYLYMNADHGVTGAIINGSYIRRHHHNLGNVTFLNITPLLRRGQDNEIQVILPGGAQQRRIYQIELRRYGP